MNHENSRTSKKEEHSAHNEKVYLNRGVMYGKCGQYQEVIADCNQAINLNLNYQEHT